MSVSTDIVIFTIPDRLEKRERLEILLIRRGKPPFSGKWALPGGFVEPGEDVDACALRELEEETGVSGIYLEQFHAFGAPRRDPRGRVVSIAYFALVPADRLRPPQAGADAAGVQWWDAQELPQLAFDHGDIVVMARDRLRKKLDESTIAYSFLPPTFTLSELQTVYEIIRGDALDKRNFRNRILSLDLIEETGDVRTGPHRPARLYRLRPLDVPRADRA